jgi:hypothetical protein
MLEGITILNQYAEITNISNWRLALIVAAIIFIVSVIVAFVCSDGDFVSVGAVIAVLVLISIIGSTAKDVPTGREIYQVTISDEVSMTEFTSKYEIIKQEGKIYTIAEKSKEKVNGRQ